MFIQFNLHFWNPNQKQITNLHFTFFLLRCASPELLINLRYNIFGYHQQSDKWHQLRHITLHWFKIHDVLDGREKILTRSVVLDGSIIEEARGAAAEPYMTKKAAKCSNVLSIQQIHWWMDMDANIASFFPPPMLHSGYDSKSSMSYPYPVLFWMYFCIFFHLII